MLQHAGRFARLAAPIWAMAVIASVGVPSARSMAAAPDQRPLAIVPAGTVVERTDRDRWNRVVFLATPRFASGDTDAVSNGIRDHVTSFTFAVLATVRTTQSDDEAPKHSLAEVGIGYATPIEGQLTIVAPDARLPGFSLDFLGRQILGAKQKSLDDIVAVGDHDTALAFDAPTMMLRADEHLEMTARHVVRVDPRTGDCSTCVWLAKTNDDGTLTPATDAIRLVTGGTRESRAIHVDGARFVFGFPTKQAFAVKDLPPGSNLPWTPSLLVSAYAPTYSGTSFQELTRAIDEAAVRQIAARAARTTDATRSE